jgi:hypothetical protein
MSLPTGLINSSYAFDSFLRLAAVFLMISDIVA